MDKLMATKIVRSDNEDLLAERIVELYEVIAKGEADNAKLREAMGKYGRHLHTCASLHGWIGPPRGGCSCGYSTALEQTGGK